MNDAKIVKRMASNLIYQRSREKVDKETNYLGVFIGYICITIRST